MSWLALIFALEAGFWSQNELLYIEPTLDTLDASYRISSPYVMLETELEFFRLVRFGGNATIYIADVAGWQYSPYDSRYAFWAKLKWNFIELGFEHVCYHPVLARDRIDLGFLYGGSDRMFIRFDGVMHGKPKS